MIVKSIAYKCSVLVHNGKGSGLRCLSLNVLTAEGSAFDSSSTANARIANIRSCPTLETYFKMVYLRKSKPRGEQKQCQKRTKSIFIHNNRIFFRC